MLIDTHAHLTDERFDADRVAVIERAKAAGVSKIIEVACDPQKWQKALDLAEANEGIYCAVGLHPQDAKLCEPDVWKELERFAALPRVIAIGETGFDYHYENSPRAKQREVFEKHIELSLNAAKPLVIHCREAYSDLIAILAGFKCRGIIHCFSGTVEEAGRLIDMGYYIGIDGPVTYPKAVLLKETVKMTPPERILIETDSPYLPPQAYRGQRNEPSYLNLIAEEIAAIKGIEPETFRKIVMNNSLELFAL